MSINIVKKLSMKLLAGDVKKLVNASDQNNIQLAKVVGIARGTKIGTSNFGDWTALIGEFVAERLTGEKAGARYRTGVMFLPDVALDLVLPLVSGLEKGSGVELAFGIGVEKDDTSSTGYIYTATFLMEPAANDPLEALMLKALPAPEATIKTVTGNPEAGEVSDNKKK